MELKGQRHLAIDRPATWRALNDPEILRACIPGCESVERVVEPGHLVPTCPRNEQREIRREIIDGFTGGGGDEAELFRRIGDALPRQYLVA